MASAFNTRLEAVRRRVAWAAFAGELSLHLLVVLFACGSLILFTRLLLGWELEQAVWILTAAAVTPFSAWWRARQRFLSAEGAANWLDVRSGATGIIVTETEIEDERWMARAEQQLASREILPSVHSGPMTARSLVGVSFSLIALWIPMPAAQSLAPTNLFDTSLQSLQEKLQTLEEEIEFEDEVAAELNAQLDRLEAEAAEANNPEATFEAIDQLSKRLEGEALEAQAAAQEAHEALQDAASSSDEAGADGMQEALEKSVETLELAGIMETLPPEISSALARSALEAAEGMTLDPAALKELSESLRGMLQQKLGQLGQAGLLKGGLQLAKLGESQGLGGFQFSEHVCDENCKIGPGGT